jgi:hypothetical protein
MVTDIALFENRTKNLETLLTSATQLYNNLGDTAKNALTSFFKGNKLDELTVGEIKDL